MKWATTDGARKRLQREAKRLSQACHPGVVEVIEHTDEKLVFAWAGGQTLATFRPEAAVAAAVLAATASTIADLHELGVIHGRLDPTHVVIGADGRPRLCGLAGTEVGAPDSTPADDVAALGRLIDGLIGPGTDHEPIPERRWSRRRLTGFQRRALQTLADHATADDPVCRPTARALAAAIAEAVPEARIEPQPSAPPSERLPRHLFPLPAVVPSIHIEAGDHAAPGHPSDQHGDNQPSSPMGSKPDADTADTSLVTNRQIETGNIGATGHDHFDRLDPVEPSAPTPFPADSNVSGPETFLGMRVGRTPADDPSIDHPTRSPSQRTGAGAHRPRNPLRAVAATAAIASVVVAAFQLGSNQTAAVARPSLASTHHTESSTAVDNAPASTIDTQPTQPSQCETGINPSRDAAGRASGGSCLERYQVDGTTIRVSGRSYTIGQPGDHVAIGDWDCNGTTTPGLIRPATGEIFLFERWAGSAAEISIAPTATVRGALSFTTVSPASECMEPRIRLADGTVHTLTAGGAG